MDRLIDVGSGLSSVGSGTGGGPLWKIQSSAGAISSQMSVERCAARLRAFEADSGSSDCFATSCPSASRTES